MYELTKKTRTVRRFVNNKPLSRELLLDLIELARLGGSARNAQVLRYMIINKGGLCEQIFPLLGWAGYLSDWPGPVPGEHPPAYIICILDKVLLQGAEHEAYFDLGISTQNLLLGAAAKGIFGCRIGAFSPKIHQQLHLGQRYKVLLVLALGYPAEKVILEEVGADDDIRYWRDDNHVHHVPKRSLADILISVPDEYELD